MFVKLSFNADTRITVPLRILTDIVNTNTITSVSALQSRFTSASYAASLTSSFDATNSLIVRTIDTSNTKAHFAYSGTALSGDSIFTIEQPVYDAPSSKIYSQIRHATSVGYFDVGTAITGGTMASSQTALTVAENLSSSSGTTLTLGGNNYGSVTAVTATGSGYNNIRTFWAYINDKGFYWCTTNGTSFNSGWGSTYADSTKFSGTFFQSQYTRFDYHNTNSNGIYPVLYTNQRGAGKGFGTASDITSVQNIYFASDTTTVPLRVNSLVSALPQVGTSWPKVYNNYVNMTIGGTSSSVYALNVVQTLGTQTSATSASYAGSISTASSTRYANANLTGTGFGILPFGWEASNLGNHGGNCSDQTGVYIFNGDYVPGDTFIYNNKLYMVWPLWSGYSNRIGFAVPME